MAIDHPPRRETCKLSCNSRKTETVQSVGLGLGSKTGSSTLERCYGVPSRHSSPIVTPSEGLALEMRGVEVSYLKKRKESANNTGGYDGKPPTEKQEWAGITQRRQVNG